MKPARLISPVALIAIGVLIGFGYGRWYGPRPGGGAERKVSTSKGYHCPMHPTFRADRPGDCGICGMKLVPDAEPDHTSHAQAPEETKSSPAVDPSSMPMGTIRVSPQKQQLIGVKTEEATVTAGAHTFRAVGKVSMDETRVAKVQTKVEGWIEKVHVDFTGKLVEKGQPLITLYSPEMLASQQEYLLAIRSREIMRSSPLAGSREQSESLLGAARKRLELWDLSDAQIDEITRTGQPIKNITVYAPISGYVMMRNAFSKQRITPDTELYTVADLSKVWIMADVFESESSMVRLGMPVTVSLPYSGGRKLGGRMDYIQPQVDMTTRTLKIRIEADNPGMALKPEMFVDVEFQVGMPARVTVPADAVLSTGLRKTVFIDRGEGYLEPRQVETGEHIGNRVEITKGVRPGERVVTSGNFLIDSESQLKSAAAGMAGHQHGGATGAGAVEPKPTPPAREHKHD